MAIEFLRTAADIVFPDSTGIVSIRSTGRPVLYNERVGNSLLNALITEREGNLDEARQSYLDAATTAIRIFESIATLRMTAVHRRSRAQYGELAVVALINAGETDRAREFAQWFTEDPLVPEGSRVRVAEMVAPETETA